MPALHARPASIWIASAAIATLGASVVVTACHANGAHVPTAMAGDVPMTIINQQSGDDICALLVMPPSSPTTENWLGSSKLASKGGRADFNVRGGTYQIAAANCAMQQNADQASGAAGKLPALELRGPTVVSFGGRPSAPPPGYAVVVVPMGKQVIEICVANGDNCETDGHCCAGPNGRVMSCKPARVGHTCQP